jgi:hypothetical protein
VSRLLKPFTPADDRDIACNWQDILVQEVEFQSGNFSVTSQQLKPSVVHPQFEMTDCCDRKKGFEVESYVTEDTAPTSAASSKVRG